MAVAGSLALTSAGLLTGCGVTSGSAAGTAMAAMGGRVNGGQSPVQGAVVNLYVTSATATGYGQAGTLIGTATTDANGNFTIAPSATTANCPAGQMAYITAAGGYPTGQPSLANNSSLMMAALGNCSGVSAATTVIINEVTTVAAAYALSGFMRTVASSNLFAANVSAPVAATASTGTTAVTAGLAHAFLNAQNLATYSSGQANSSTASITAAGATVTGTVPAAEINTLGDILQSCVNGATGNSSCTSLFSFTPSISGTAPANTLQAMINLARNPYPSSAAMTASSGLFSLVSSSPAFLPNLSSQPPDWSLAVVYKGTALVAPYDLAIDANDTVYYGASASANIVGLSPYGTSTSAFTAGTGTATRQLAPDALGNIWVTNNGTTVYQFKAGSTAAPTAYAGYTDTFGVAVDKANNVWVADAVLTSPNITQLQYGAGSPATYTANYTATTATYEPVELTIDANQNVWAADYYTGGNQAVVLPNLSAANTSATPTYAASGTTATPITATFASSATKPLGVVIDASGNAWYGITGSNSVTTTGIEEVIPSFTSSVITALTPQPLITGATLGAKASQIPGIDGAGSIYLPDNQGAGALGVHVYSTVSVASSNTGGQVLSPPAGYLGCAQTVNVTTGAITCGTGSSSAVYNPREIAIDSTGSVWAGITTGGLTQLIGLGAPTWPLLSIGKPGVAPGLTAAQALP